MKNKLIPALIGILGPIALSITLVAGALLAPCSASATENKARVFPSTATVHDKTYGEWAATWWQWALSIPESQNPVLDATGAFSAVGQSGPVWFLAGTFGGAVERTFSVPANQPLFMPVFNWIFGAGVFDCDPSVPGVPCDVLTLRANAAAATETATLLEAYIDGVPVTNIPDYRAASPTTFSVTFPEGAVFGLPAGTHAPHVADGYWLMIKPLKAGAHTITVRVESSLGFVNDVVYNIIAE